MKNSFNSYIGKCFICFFMFLAIVCTVSFSSKASNTVIKESEIKDFLLKKAGISKTGGNCQGWATEQYTELGLEFPKGVTGPCAVCAGDNAINQGILSTSNDIPIGAFIYFGEGPDQTRLCSTCGRLCGHAGLYVGDGNVISLQGSNKITVRKISEWDSWGYKYRGWAIPTNITIIRDVTKPKSSIKGPYIDNVTDDGFDVVFNVSGIESHQLSRIYAVFSFFYIPSEVSWGWNSDKEERIEVVYESDYPNGQMDTYTKGDKYYKDGKISIHCWVLDDYAELYAGYNYSNDSGSFPSAGISRGPYLESFRLFPEDFMAQENGVFVDYSDDPILISGLKIYNPDDEELIIVDYEDENKDSDDAQVDEPEQNNISEDNTKPSPSQNENTENPSQVSSGTNVAPVGLQFNIGDRNFVVTGKNQIRFNGTSKKNLKKIVVPNYIEYDGEIYNVTEIAADAMKGNKKLKEVTIGENVKFIRKGAFKDCKNLSRINIYAKNLQKVDKTSFSGTAKKMKVYIRFKDQAKKYVKKMKKSGISKEAQYYYKKLLIK